MMNFDKTARDNWDRKVAKRESDREHDGPGMFSVRQAYNPDRDRSGKKPKKRRKEEALKRENEARKAVILDKHREQHGYGGW